MQLLFFPKGKTLIIRCVIYFHLIYHIRKLRERKCEKLVIPGMHSPLIKWVNLLYLLMLFMKVWGACMVLRSLDVIFCSLCSSVPELSKSTTRYLQARSTTLLWLILITFKYMSSGTWSFYRTKYRIQGLL